MAAERETTDRLIAHFLADALGVPLVYWFLGGFEGDELEVIPGVSACLGTRSPGGS